MSTFALSDFQEQEYKLQFAIYLGTTFVLMGFVLIFALIWENQTLTARIEKLENAEKLQLLSNEGLSGLIRTIQENMPLKGDVAMMSDLFYENAAELRALRNILGDYGEQIAKLDVNFHGLCRENESVLYKHGVVEKKLVAIGEDIGSLAERVQRMFDDFEETKRINKYNQETLLENQDTLAANLEKCLRQVSK